jgi:dihydropteroate synthase
MSRQSDIRWEARGHTIKSAADPVPKVMGIVNLTPDSFSDGGRLSSPVDAVNYALRLAGDGADLLDLGAESSRPGAEPVSGEEELSRIIPVLRMLSDSLPIPISIDTSKADVARAALAAGASIINDISALSADPGMAAVVAGSSAGVVLMHMQGTPSTMQANPRYHDVVSEIHDFLAERIDWAGARGIPRERIAIDPGIGFGKTREHNLELLRNLERFANLGCAILVGVSRKGFLGSITGKPVSERAASSVAASLEACLRGAQVVRVHDVADMADAIRVWTALGRWEFRS